MQKVVSLFARTEAIDELPRVIILGNPYSSTRTPVRYRGAWWRHSCLASFLVEVFSAPRCFLSPG